MKSPSNKPARYDKAKLTIDTLKQEPKTFLKHVWYLIDDFVIGRSYENASMKVKINKETGKPDVNWDPGAKPQGIGGYLHANLIVSFARILRIPFAALGMLTPLTMFGMLDDHSVGQPCFGSHCGGGGCTCAH